MGFFKPNFWVSYIKIHADELIFQETDADHMREAFKLFDEDQNGYISADEVSSA